MGKKIGIMGGTFNPVHVGHLLLAEHAREVLALDEVLFIPSGNSYMKDSSEILDGAVRAHLLALAIEKNPHFHLSYMEINREGATYTCDTIAELKKQNVDDEYYLIVGADNLLTLENWKNPDFILQNCIVAAAVRGTGTEERLEKIAAHLIYEYQADIRILPARYMDLSSSEIRRRLRDGKTARYMLPDKVYEYIEANGLYQ
ncbi:MAG: nicotinate-nucleotide adenylyltransferase [Lachnospiraceae bacterium]|nr:nicotinate-nucleotide adenylyltransferase [Lachnospiraceae bacterium]MDE6185386.1 nicotinate-nucleotide adenylyltransferase [Lachnospiraceae bacterium]